MHIYFHVTCGTYRTVCQGRVLLVWLFHQEVTDHQTQHKVSALQYNKSTQTQFLQLKSVSDITVYGFKVYQSMRDCLIVCKMLSRFIYIFLYSAVLVGIKPLVYPVGCVIFITLKCLYYMQWTFKKKEKLLFAHSFAFVI